MTRKHFRAIASAIAKERRDAFSVHARVAIDTTAKRLADELARFNPAFNRERFLAACKGE